MQLVILYEIIKFYNIINDQFLEKKQSNLFTNRKIVYL